jgi:3-oxoacyl-[acyl-carrier protein] reductase
MPDGGVALVAGASGTLGGAVAAALDAAGLSVACHHHTNAAAAAEVAAGLDHPAMTVAADLADWTSVREAAEKVRAELGAVDVVVNCAAVRHDGLLAGQSPAEWRAVVDVNLIGAFHLSRAFLPDMIARRYGRIVHVVSPVASLGSPGQTAYAASKAGVVALTRSLAHECGSRGVTVNAVSPGYMRSALTAAVPAAMVDLIMQRTPIRRPVDPVEVARAVAFLVGSPDITGQVRPVDGGLSA